MRPKQNGRHFADDIFICIFLDENVWIPIKISLKFVPKVPINNIPSLVEIMAWWRPGDKPLSEPIMIRLPLHICVTRPQWVNSLWPSDAKWCQRSELTLVEAIACCLAIIWPMLTHNFSFCCKISGFRSFVILRQTACFQIPIHLQVISRAYLGSECRRHFLGQKNPVEKSINISIK